MTPAAVATVVGTLAFTAVGTFGDGTDGANHGVEEFLVIARHRRRGSPP